MKNYKIVLFTNGVIFFGISLLSFSSVSAQKFSNEPIQYEITAEFFPKDASVRGNAVSPQSFMRAQTEDDLCDINVKRVTIKAPNNFHTVVVGTLIHEENVDGKVMSIWEPGLIGIEDLQCISAEYNILSQNNVFVHAFKDAQSAHGAEEIARLFLPVFEQKRVA